MARLRLLDGVGRQHPDGVDAELIQLFLVRHSTSPS
jgi:hypothetical protein